MWQWRGVLSALFLGELVISHFTLQLAIRFAIFSIFGE